MPIIDAGPAVSISCGSPEDPSIAALIKIYHFYLSYKIRNSLPKSKAELFLPYLIHNSNLQEVRVHKAAWCPINASICLFKQTTVMLLSKAKQKLT